MDALDRLRRQLVAAVAQPKPQVPEAGRLLWRVFCGLHNARPITMAGPQAITHEAIEAFARIERLPLRADHVEILRAMDDAWLASVRGSGGDPRKPPAMEATPALFDAVFG